MPHPIDGINILGSVVKFPWEFLRTSGFQSMHLWLNYIFQRVKAGARTFRTSENKKSETSEKWLRNFCACIRYMLRVQFPRPPPLQYEGPP